MLISILSTSLVLQIFVFFFNFLCFIFSLLCDKLAGTLGCVRREPAENLIPLDPEIERTLKRILRDKREATIME